MAYDLASAGHSLVVAAGGDGTINEVVAGITDFQQATAGSDSTTLGILPIGTMNVFARELGIPRGNLPAAWETIEADHLADIDIWFANDMPFIQMAGVGLDAEIIRRTTWQSKKRLGPLSYLLSWLLLPRAARGQLRVALPGSAGLPTGCAVLVGNGRLYGGSFSFFPDACNRDGLIDILIFRKLNALVLLQLAIALLFSRRCTSSHVSYERAESLEVVSCDDTALPFEVDGEYAGQTPVTFRKATRALRVAVPLAINH